jgi:cell division protein FtsB
MEKRIAQSSRDDVCCARRAIQKAGSAGKPTAPLFVEGKHRSGREPDTVARKPSKEPRRKRRLRLLLPVVVLTVMAFLYYRPLSTYLQTRDELGARRAQVVMLRAEKVRLERRLARTTSDAALAREARRIGYVKPGERLFIVKGIATWQRQHHATTP